MSNTNKKLLASGSIIALALTMGVSVAQADAGKSQASNRSQASDHASERAKQRLGELGSPGASEHVRDIGDDEDKGE